MVLRLSSQPALAMTDSSSATSKFVDRIVQDSSLSLGQKTDCLKTLSVVIKNLCDPVKSQDAKYRALKLDNAKLQATLFSIVYVQDLLQLVGFELVDGTLTMPIPDPTCQRGLKTLSQELLKAQESMQEPTNKKPRVEEKLSEKQKARRMMEEKRKADVLKAKEERKRNIEMLKHDKLVRETDPNWKPGVSAACAKSGTGLKSFRDRHGE